MGLSTRASHMTSSTTKTSWLITVPLNALESRCTRSRVREQAMPKAFVTTHLALHSSQHEQEQQHICIHAEYILIKTRRKSNSSSLLISKVSQSGKYRRGAYSNGKDTALTSSRSPHPSNGGFRLVVNGKKTMPNADASPPLAACCSCGPFRRTYRRWRECPTAMPTVGSGCSRLPCQRRRVCFLPAPGLSWRDVKIR